VLIIDVFEKLLQHLHETIFFRNTGFEFINELQMGFV